VFPQNFLLLTIDIPEETNTLQLRFKPNGYNWKNHQLDTVRDLESRMEYYGYTEDGDIAKELDISYLKKDYMTVQLKHLEEPHAHHYVNKNTFKYYIG
jgi:hypothetical protein